MWPVFRIVSTQLYKYAWSSCTIPWWNKINPYIQINLSKNNYKLVLKTYILIVKGYYSSWTWCHLPHLLEQMLYFSVNIKSILKAIFIIVRSSHEMKGRWCTFLMMGMHFHCILERSKMHYKKRYHIDNCSTGNNQHLRICSLVNL